MFKELVDFSNKISKHTNVKDEPTFDEKINMMEQNVGVDNNFIKNCAGNYRVVTPRPFC